VPLALELLGKAIGIDKVRKPIADLIQKLHIPTFLITALEKLFTPIAKRVEALGFPVGVVHGGRGATHGVHRLRDFAIGIEHCALYVILAHFRA